MGSRLLGSAPDHYLLAGRNPAGLTSLPGTRRIVDSCPLYGRDALLLCEPTAHGEDYQLKGSGAGVVAIASRGCESPEVVDAPEAAWPAHVLILLQRVPCAREVYAAPYPPPNFICPPGARLPNKPPITECRRSP